MNLATQNKILDTKMKFEIRGWMGIWIGRWLDEILFEVLLTVVDKEAAYFNNSSCEEHKLLS